MSSMSEGEREGGREGGESVQLHDIACTYT